MALLSSCHVAITALLFCLVRVSGETKVTLEAAANKLRFEENDIGSNTKYRRAVDGNLTQWWKRCAISRPSSPTVWLSIDLGRLYPVNKIKFLSREQFGRGSQIYVGKNASSSNGTNDHQCGKNVVISDPAPPHLTVFPCSPVKWVQYVSIRRTGYIDKDNEQKLHVCEVEVYFEETEDLGITITKNTVPISKLDVRTIEDILLCGSSEGDFGPTWKFPDGTDVSDKRSPSIWQRNGSSGYKELHLSPLCTTPPNGQYMCQYTANNVRKVETVSLNFTGTKCDVVCNQDETTFFGSAGILFLALFAVALVAFIALLVAHIRLRQISKKSYVVNDQRRIHEMSNNIKKKENTKLEDKLTESDAYGAKYQKGCTGDENSEMYTEIPREGTH